MIQPGVPGVYGAHLMTPSSSRGTPGKSLAPFGLGSTFSGPSVYLSRSEFGDQRHLADDLAPHSPSEAQWVQKQSVWRNPSRSGLGAQLGYRRQLGGVRWGGMGRGQGADLAESLKINPE